MKDQEYTICVAKSLPHAAWCLGIIEKFFEPYPKKMLMWYTHDRSQIVVKMLGSPHEVELAKSIIASRELSEKINETMIALTQDLS